MDNVRPLTPRAGTHEIRIVLQLNTENGRVELPEMPRWEMGEPTSLTADPKITVSRPEALEPLETLSSAEVVSLEAPRPATPKPEGGNASPQAHVTATVAHRAPPHADDTALRTENTLLEARLSALETTVEELKARNQELEQQRDHARESLRDATESFETRERQLVEKCRSLRAQTPFDAHPNLVRRVTDRLSETLDLELFRPWYRKPATVVLLAIAAAAAAAWLGYNAIGPLAL
ncbi:MAG: hypothetical protein AAF658_01815 [Myxococcota bacterium]